MEPAVEPEGLSLFFIFFFLFFFCSNIKLCGLLNVKYIPDSPCRVVRNRGTACILVVVKSSIA